MKVLHVFTDNKFFDPISNRFDCYLNIENIYLYYTTKSNYKFKYIKNIQKIRIVTNYKEYVSYFNNKDIDVIYFHALYYKSYLLFKHIDPKKIVVWWVWGFDVYEEFMGLPPIVRIDTLKPLTRKYEKRYTLKKILKSFYFFFLKNKMQQMQQKVLQRIDYVQPVLPIEFDLLKKAICLDVKCFSIKENAFNRLDELIIHRENGNILIGNSATITNNHLDVLDVFNINKIHLQSGREIVFPLNYGSEKYKHFLINYIPRNLTCKFKILHEFMARDEYSNIIKSITHAVFGSVRQQAMWNVFTCIRNGCKLFFFNDSIIYKQLIAVGFKVFTIEHDLAREINSPLMSSEAICNYNLLFKMKSEKEDTILELLKGISEKSEPTL